MGAFEVVYSPIKPIWMPVDYGSGGASTVYEGQIVTSGAVDTCQGVKPWVVAGLADTTTDHVPFGVVIGTNNRTPLYSSTYNSQYITSVQSQANQVARDWAYQEGMWKKGDPAAMVQVALITPETVLKGRIFNSSWGTAPTEAVVTTGSTTGTGFTCGTTGFDFTAVAYNATYYGRSGANAGLYRVGYDTGAGTAAKTMYLYWPYDVAVGDKFIGVNVGLGTCKAMLDGAGMFIDTSAAVGTTNYIWIDVLSLDLATAGSETVIFRLNPLQLLGVRA